MTATDPVPGEGYTRWRRLAALLGLSAAATAVLLAMVANGAVAAGFTVSGQQFKVSADELVATGFIQYGTVDARVEPGGDNQIPEPVAVSAMKTATLKNLCQSVVTDLGDFGSVSLKIRAGTGGDPATARDMVVDMSQLDGNANFTNIEIGRDASTLDKGPTNDPGEQAQRRQGMFSQQADTVTITDLKQVAWATAAGQFNLRHLSLRLHWGRDECF
ncbi:hypothetical protein EV385_0913 [Krasilnikovia cinnamomea]|uniref:Cholesterol esterase n=1 Tax=Krasilnikovia cinnamomea TaxID=349313 RepID=A0A4Q7ZEP8_9ACTN|nr:DUF6230 family protein [Krasilnikovia cinnamomea]RZU49177.1 hypothetical protein EV385_0913 [Krasilnikovia cinnamomea]